jgi:hypothetical protein
MGKFLATVGLCALAFATAAGATSGWLATGAAPGAEATAEFRAPTLLSGETIRAARVPSGIDTRDAGRLRDALAIYCRTKLLPADGTAEHAARCADAEFARIDSGIRIELAMDLSADAALHDLRAAVDFGILDPLTGTYQPLALFRDGTDHATGARLDARVTCHSSMADARSAQAPRPCAAGPLEHVRLVIDYNLTDLAAEASHPSDSLTVRFLRGDGGSFVYAVPVAGLVAALEPVPTAVMDAAAAR